MVSIEPKLEGDNVQLTVLVGAMSDESKLKFLKALEGSPEFSHIELLSEQRPTRTDAARPRPAFASGAVFGNLNGMKIGEMK